MHKKLSAELVRLAHQILKIDENTDIRILRDKARKIYEDLSVLYFIDDYFVETPDVTGDKGDFLQALQNIEATKTNTIIVKKQTPAPEEKSISVKEVAPTIETKKEPVSPASESQTPVITKTTSVSEADKKQLEEQTDKTIKKEAKQIVAKIETSKVTGNSFFEKEMKDSVPADVQANMFEKATPKVASNKDLAKPTKEEPIVVESIKEPVKKAHVNIAEKQQVTKQPKKEISTTLNDRILNQKIQVGLNDRIAFVKHLFDFSQENFNLVLSKLNSFMSEEDCINYLNNDVKKELDWSEKEEYEERLLVLIERRFS